MVDSAAISLPDAELEEFVAAAVVVRPGTAVSADDLNAFAAERLSTFAVPARWWLREEPHRPTRSARLRLQAAWPIDPEGEQ